MLTNLAVQLTSKQTSPAPPANIEGDKMLEFISGLGQVCLKDNCELQGILHKPAPTDGM
jgi:hypothetical protein